MANTELDVRAKLARIDRALADHDRKRQDAPWPAIITGMTIGATLFAAGAVLMRIWG